MENFNAIVNGVREAMPLVQSGITALVGGFVTSMFLRGNTRRSEFEKIKVGKINEVLDDLVDNRELTLTELVKCKNLLKIAKLADREYEKQSKNHKSDDCKSNDGRKEFDFDWCLRFFEAAGNVSNTEMQIYWARLLSNEVRLPGSVHPAFIDIIRQLSLLDAQNLYCFKENSTLPIVEYRKRKENKEKETLITDVFLENKNETDIFKQSASISNLLRLGIIFFSYSNYIFDDKVYEPFKQHEFYKSLQLHSKEKIEIRKGKLMLSPLGVNFTNVCFEKENNYEKV